MEYFKEKNNYLSAIFEFKKFSEALDFVNKIGGIAEKLEHHPDIKIFDYCFVKIDTTTHNAGNTITQKDYDMVKFIESIYVKKGKNSQG